MSIITKFFTGKSAAITSGMIQSEIARAENEIVTSRSQLARRFAASGLLLSLTNFRLLIGGNKKGQSHDWPLGILWR
jgi:hypothetical protein